MPCRGLLGAAGLVLATAISANTDAVIAADESIIAMIVGAAVLAIATTWRTALGLARPTDYTD